MYICDKQILNRYNIIIIQHFTPKVYGNLYKIKGVFCAKTQLKLNTLTDNIIIANFYEFWNT